MKCEIPVRHAIKSIYAAIQVAHINSQFQIIIDISRRTAIPKNQLFVLSIHKHVFYVQVYFSRKSNHQQII